MAKTSIEWTDVTWNPVRGCSRVSEGCRNCYAEKVAARFSAPGMPYDGLAKRGPARWTGEVRLIEEHLEDPLKWRKPQRVFVNSMSDLFHEKLSITRQTDIFEVMAKCPQHTFQVLTKRAGLLFRMKQIGVGVAYRLGKEREPGFWPLPNVHLGVSIEDQKTADERIPLLLQAPAAVHFISAEPLLEPVNFYNYLDRPGLHDAARRIDWVIVGGESGSGARPCDLSWIRSVAGQCNVAGVPVFVKQLGARPILDCPEGEEGEGQFRDDGSARYWTLGYVKDRKGGDIEEFPDDLKVRQFPHIS